MPNRHVYTFFWGVGVLKGVSIHPLIHLSNLLTISHGGPAAGKGSRGGKFR